MMTTQTGALERVYEIQTIRPYLTICVVDMNAFATLYLRGIDVETFRYQKNRDFSAADVKCPLFGAEEFERINSFKTLKKQVEWMCGRLAVKTLVAASASSPVALADIIICYHSKGAPYLKDGRDRHISISHSHDYAVAGLSCRPDIDIGLDLEKIEAKNLKFLLNVAFTEREKRHLALDDYSTIYTHWTIKEAYLKYLKQGFHENLQKVEIIDGRLHYDRKLVTGLEIFTNEIRKGYAFTLLYQSVQGCIRYAEETGG